MFPQIIYIVDMRSRAFVILNNLSNKKTCYFSTIYVNPPLSVVDKSQVCVYVYTYV